MDGHSCSLSSLSKHFSVQCMARSSCHTRSDIMAAKNSPAFCLCSKFQEGWVAHWSMCSSMESVPHWPNWGVKATLLRPSSPMVQAQMCPKCLRPHPPSVSFHSIKSGVVEKNSPQPLSSPQQVQRLCARNLKWQLMYNITATNLLQTQEISPL